MKKNLILSVLAVFLGLVLLMPFMGSVQAATPGRQQAGNVLYKLPAGWKAVNQDNVVSLLPAGKTPETSDVIIAITPGLDLNGHDFRTIFDTIVQGLDAKDTLLKRSDVKTLETAQYNVLTQVSIIQQANGGKLYKAYVATNPGDHLDMILYITTSEQALQQYQPIFSNFIDSVAFVNVENGTAALAKKNAAPTFTYNTRPQTPVNRNNSNPFNKNPFATPHFNGFDAFNGGHAFNAFKTY